METKTKKRNTAFAKLSPARKRVQVAKDVLRLIANEKIVPTAGFYVLTQSRDRYGFTRPSFAEIAPPKSSDLRDALNAEPCHACQLGAMFCASVIRNDKVPLRRYANSDSISRETIRRHFCGVFDTRQLRAIEDCFEGVGQFGEAYDARFKQAPARQIAICKNLIRNSGTFKPEQDVRDSATARVNARIKADKSID